MIYLKNITDAQTLMIPRSGEVVSGDLSLIGRNTTDHQGFTLSVTDLNTSGLYFNLAVVLPGNLANGEYHYQLMDGEILVSCGLLVIGDPENPYQYEKTLIYKQYESE